LSPTFRTNVAKMSVARYSSCAVVVDNKIVVSGGTTTLANGQTADLVTMI
jgi:hypothetical protein